MERIFTIPVNEAFEAVRTEGTCTCPFCLLYNKLESNEIDLILGASMMEPDVRQKTNEMGFCEEHLNLMFEMGKRLPLALILESHLNSIAEKIDGSMSSLFIKKTADNAAKTLNKLDQSCYICSRIENNFKSMIETAALLWQTDEDFRQKVRETPYFCLKHFGRFVAAAKERLSGREFAEFYENVYAVEEVYFDKLREDVSFFCKKFDYRYADEPWGDSKDAPERAKKFLNGDLHILDKSGKNAGGLT